MGKSLVIKGADFSNSGFNIGYITEEHTKLYSVNGNEISDLSQVTNQEGIYVFNDNVNSASVKKGTSLSGIAISEIINVEGWEKLDYQGNGSGSHFGGGSTPIVMCVLSFFSEQPIIPSSGQQITGTVLKVYGAVNSSSTVVSGSVVDVTKGSLNELSNIDIPSGAKYLLCAQQYIADAPSFKVTLKKHGIIPN